MITEVTVTANNHLSLGYGCIDSISFKTNDGQTKSCNARDGTLYSNNNLISKTFTIPSPGELGRIDLWARSNCVVGQIYLYYKTCTDYDLSLVSMDASGINNQKK